MITSVTVMLFSKLNFVMHGGNYDSRIAHIMTQELVALTEFSSIRNLCIKSFLNSVSLTFKEMGEGYKTTLLI